jgi:hypothetical protein
MGENLELWKSDFGLEIVQFALIMNITALYLSLVLQFSGNIFVLTRSSLIKKRLIEM